MPTPDWKLSLITFPERWDGKSMELHLRVLVLPRSNPVLVQREMEKPGLGDKVDCTLAHGGRFAAFVPIPKGKDRAASCRPPFGLGPRVGARVVSPRSPILRPGHPPS